MRARIVVALGMVVAALALASMGAADPNLSNIPQHRHWVETPSGNFVQVGPRVCDNANLQNAFNQFHNNIHAVSATGIGPAAPGLHNDKGADMTFSGCAVLLG
jgi:hypothetical protein